MAVSGDRVKLQTESDFFEGILMPEEKQFVVLKLDTGYNISVSKDKIKQVQLLKKHSPVKVEIPKASQDSSKPKITILHTGGTIASKVDYETGGVIAKFSPEELLGMFPELKDIAQISSRLVSNMFSEDMRFAHYNILARECEKELNAGVHGIIITHGTDTLHYSSAALAFALGELPVPVILVGAQRSSDRGSSDAGANIIAAAAFIAKSDFAEVGVCMHAGIDDEWCVILPAAKCRKMHSSRRDAFAAINTLPWARVHLKERKIEWMRTDYRKRTARKSSIRLFKEGLKIALIKTHTNMYAEQFLFYKGWDGLLVEGFGIAGNVPINEIDKPTAEHKKIADAIKSLTSKGTIMAAATQTIAGRINMNVYSTGRMMQELGIIGHLTDMTAETGFIKLAWLLSNFPKNKIKELYEQNIVGEISERHEV
ncbi:MAG: Glu-tRNA(Gln) amidotransferase subunit GatD [Candidatus Aenigmarchaeota archaeon]|nr:Glu-tRNA(Gln) amidotransferase subunit GatD [Candidatus Aenigmarchaeota archaeon]